MNKPTDCNDDIISELYAGSHSSKADREHDSYNASFFNDNSEEPCSMPLEDSLDSTFLPDSTGGYLKEIGKYKLFLELTSVLILFF
jgi:hypothetical protein